MNVPAIKVWKVDYSFLIKNYLDQRLWDHTWTLFEYGDYIINLRMSSIYVSSKEIAFFVSIRNIQGGSLGSIVYYHLENDSIEFFVKRLNGKIFNLIMDYEKEYIEEFDDYKILERMIIDEEYRLSEIAEEFLDNENITNEEIREMYIENYVDKNSKAEKYKNDFFKSAQYHYLTDLYLVYLESIKDEDRRMRVLNSLDDNERNEVLEQIKEYHTQLETDEYEEEMKAELEAIKEVNE